MKRFSQFMNESDDNNYIIIVHYSADKQEIFGDNGVPQKYSKKEAHLIAKEENKYAKGDTIYHVKSLQDAKEYIKRDSEAWKQIDNMRKW